MKEAYAVFGAKQREEAKPVPTHENLLTRSSGTAVSIAALSCPASVKYSVGLRQDMRQKMCYKLEMSEPSDKNPVVEQKPNDNHPDDLTSRTLRQRIHQQELLAELGVLALQGTSFISMLNHTARMTAEGLGAEYCKVLEYISAEGRLLVRAGVGWSEGVVGTATVGADLASPAGYALRTGKPVISNHLENEQRFRTPELLVEHGIRRAMNVILQGDGSPFGVLEVDSRSEGEFGEHDVAFLQGAANILGMAIEQQQYQRKLRTALDRHQILLKEVNHRVKNSLQVISSMLLLQASAAGDPGLSEHLNDASARISAVGRAYERLAYNPDYENIDLVQYLKEVIDDLQTAVAPCTIDLDAPEEIQIAAERAILLALIINELVSNASKYAYPDCPDGRIWVRIVRTKNNAILISVRDEGVGLPTDFDPAKSKRLGTRLINALSGQLGAEVTRPTSEKGAHFALIVPIHPDTPKVD
ncbi:MAG: sensor histidine kinase [Xanthobacteraceae bacterium]